MYVLLLIKHFRIILNFLLFLSSYTSQYLNDYVIYIFKCLRYIHIFLLRTIHYIISPLVIACLTMNKQVTSFWTSLTSKSPSCLTSTTEAFMSMLHTCYGDLIRSEYNISADTGTANIDVLLRYYVHSASKGH